MASPSTTLPQTWKQKLFFLAAAVYHADAFASKLATTARHRFFTHTRHQPLPTTLLYKIHDEEMAQTVNMNTDKLKIPPLSSILTNSWSLPQDEVRLSLLPSPDGDLHPYPLVVRPKHDSSIYFLTGFVNNNRGWLDSQLTQYGAILFRGFGLNTTDQVETAIQALEPYLSDTYRGTSPRSAQDGTKYVFSSAEVPSHFPIAQHLEMSFLPALPRRVFFSALQAPQLTGGETALADFRQVYRAIPKTLREKMLSKKLRYTRTLHRRGFRWSPDVASQKSWSEVYGTNDKAKVEEIAKEEGIPMRWGRKDSIVSQYESNAFERHPQTGEMTWFNHAQVFHWTSFPAELWYAFRRTKDLRFFFHSAAIWVFSIFWYGLLRRRMALNVTFGDGSAISIREMQQIRKAIHKNMVLNRWEKGDLVMIDNLSTSHGRQPTYDHGRRVVVAWSDVVEKSRGLMN